MGLTDALQGWMAFGLKMLKRHVRTQAKSPNCLEKCVVPELSLEPNYQQDGLHCVCA